RNRERVGSSPRNRWRLMEITEKARYSLKRSWVQKALARGKRTQRRELLKNMPQCCHS
ncbi:unnamed protein product, partial [Musa acuminata subsp. burmannicoides]